MGVRLLLLLYTAALLCTGKLTGMFSLLLAQVRLYHGVGLGNE